MTRTWWALAAGIGLGAGAMAMASAHDEGEKVNAIAERMILEKLDGKDAKVTFVEVTIEPGQAGVPHRHPGPGFGYILEGEYEWAIDDQPAKILKAGETFYEPTKCLHRVSRNPSTRQKARLLAVVLQPRDGGPVAVPEPAHE
ncbi:cupin domain-containing protein [Tundrisphaera sp. TA3]|uniref:cupin domain-containing protein n=1 Tax=Tundrisphaera sp. TA3 TaxID=3435775 RepID=UPI003EB9C129